MIIEMGVSLSISGISDCLHLGIALSFWVVFGGVVFVGFRGNVYIVVVLCFFGCIQVV